MGIDRFHRFDVEFDEAFPKGLVLNGEVEPDYEFQPDRNAPKRIKVDERTGMRQFKAICSDPAHVKESEASVKVVFLAEYQPVPNTDEFVKGCGMRPVVLEGLQVTPKVTGQGEFKKLGWNYYATGFARSDSPADSAPAAGKTSGGKTAGGDAAAPKTAGGDAAGPKAA